ncbi:protein N-lysine methyltransferase METTL21A [Phoenix dactylifera]|uniref:Protein N-lysine methyltransferase METTL21A n=1 Tax=Phoenix dactylifera TaxID=42345 RepID=A0A8B7BR34_PHODC|nr:protein N-lysine methyltransferase METTL21A [Phoenix dactylifera]
MADEDEDSDIALLLLSTLHDDGDEAGEEATQDDAAAQWTANQQHYLLRSVGDTIVIRQLPSRGLSFQLWPAASSLVSLLDRNPSALLLPTPPSPSPLRILELGCGTGLVGIAAAAILGAHVTLTDLPHVLPNVRFNADSNAPALAPRGGSLDVRPLSWGDRHAGGSLDGSVFDVVMASDVVYHEHLLDPLVQTLEVFVRGEVAFLMAHLRRWKKRDSVFFRKARKLFDVAVLHTDPPLPGCRNGVTIYRFTAKKRAPIALTET